MFDIYLRNLKDAIVNPFLTFVKNQTFSPNYITIASGVLGLVGVFLSAKDQRYLAFCFHLISRVFDGLDGAYARLTN